MLDFPVETPGDLGLGPPEAQGSDTLQTRSLSEGHHIRSGCEGGGLLPNPGPSQPSLHLQEGWDSQALSPEAPRWELLARHLQHLGDGLIQPNPSKGAQGTWVGGGAKSTCVISRLKLSGNSQAAGAKRHRARQEAGR